MAANVHQGLLIIAATCNTPREERAHTQRAATTLLFFLFSPFVFLSHTLTESSAATRSRGASKRRFAITTD